MYQTNFLKTAHDMEKHFHGVENRFYSGNDFTVEKRNISQIRSMNNFMSDDFPQIFVFVLLTPPIQI